jgi:F-type H+-transporting ATPase subunit gamma
MANQRDIKRRIVGVKNTGKITRAMEMISAVKMRKASSAVVAIRPYAENTLAVLRQIAVALSGESHPYLVTRPVKRELYIVISSNRGLCGAFNAQIIKKVRQILEEDKERQATFITVGKKAESALRRMGQTILASFPEVIAEPTSESVRVIAAMAAQEFKQEKVDRVVVIYTDYVSVMSQVVRVRALLPVTLKDTEKQVANIDGLPGEQVPAGETVTSEYLIEPSPAAVLETLVPKLISMTLYHGVLESRASEEAARMMAMRNATDAAKDMGADLTLRYNQLRQQKITQEIAELSAGMAAVSQ